MLTVLPITMSQVIVKGKVDKRYKAKTLQFFYYTDYITFQDTVLVSALIDSNGYFKASFPLNSTRLIMANYGRKLLKIFVEPNKSYHILLPEYKDKTIADSLNPYFEQEVYWLGLTDTSSVELNRQILRFLTQYNALLSKNFYMILQKGYRINLDTFYQRIDSMFGGINNNFLQNYITYKLAYLKFMSTKRNMQFITWQYFTHKPVLYNNPAYMELFNGLYHSFFQYYYNTSKGQRIYNDIAKGKSPYLIIKTLQNRYELQDDTLAEFIMLKGLYDGAYPSKLADFSFFPREQILMTLDSVIYLSKIEIHRNIAKQIKKKILYDFFKSKKTLKSLTFYDSDNKKMKFDFFKGKFNYIVFCDINNLPCKENFSLLQRLAEKKKNVLQVTAIFLKSQKQAVEDYFTANRFTFSYYFVDGIKHLNSCNISIFPTYILIDPYGKIIQNHAPAPTKDFEYYFNEILKNRN